jgi:multidrug efflux pump subunit AcrA (membrane-fusion protein)
MTFERSQKVKRLTLIVASALVLLLSACGGSSTTNPPTTNPPMNNPENGASFSVKGTWTGTAKLENDTTQPISFVFDNNGGATGQSLAGTMTLEGVGTLTFKNSYVAPLAGASQVSKIDVTDNQGYLYTLSGYFSEKRMDDGLLLTRNPAFITSGGQAILDVIIVKQ